MKLKSGFFEKINKIDKSLTRLTKEERWGSGKIRTGEITKIPQKYKGLKKNTLNS